MQSRVPFSPVLAAALVAVVAGCTSTVAGSVISPSRGGTDAARPDPGNYPAKPASPYGNADSPAVGAVIEAHRMAAEVVVPNEVDPALTKPSWFNTGTLGMPDVLSIDIPSPGPQIAAAHHVLFGFSTCRVSAGPVDRQMLINVVLRFPDPPAATAAAAELADRVPPPVPGHPVPIQNHPAALAATYDAPDFHAAASFLPHGPYLLYQYAQSPQGTDAAARLIATTLDLQTPRIDAFRPTDPARFPDLPIDSIGFLNRVVPPDNGVKGTADFGAYQPQAALHFEADANARQLYGAGGVDAVAILRTTVYRARDPVSAQQLAAMAAADTAVQPGAAPAAGVPGLPSAKCFENRQRSRDQSAARFQCFGTAGRYSFKAASQDLLDVQQQMASQFLMLTA
ncbi:MAG: hypothetical protein JO044_14750 [Mycobacteriaceae bacterium]|nr:hypothetical protein [Mycobacteriaceae bacterium]MBV9641652.1 hypothetical protein [Mycobacteriaceae bacterium]